MIRGLSIRQPWPWAILYAGKRIENRTHCSWHGYRGEILVHASKSMTKREHLEAVRFIVRACGYGRRMFPTYEEITGDRAPSLLPGHPWGDSVRLGGIVGRARVIDSILPGGLTSDGDRHPLASDPWYTGDYGLVLDAVRPTRLVPCKGDLGLWIVPPEVLSAVKEAA
jgi:hypothetical protein